MPAPDLFVDTNILIYAISTEPAEAAKANLARNVLATIPWAWSAQVAAEFINVATSKRRATPLSLIEAEQWIDLWSAFPMVSIDQAIVKNAIRVSDKFGISYFDAQIVAAARFLGCSKLYTEDLNAGQSYDGVTVINPLASLAP